MKLMSISARIFDTLYPKMGKKHHYRLRVQIELDIWWKSMNHGGSSEMLRKPITTSWAHLAYLSVEPQTNRNNVVKFCPEHGCK